MAAWKGAKVTWLGHSVVLVTTPKGTNILIDPFIENNPKFPKNFKLPNIDLVLVTHGHFDHIADAASVAKKYGATVAGMFELTGWLQSKGVEKTVGMNLGGTYKHADVSVTQVEARHSSGIQDGDKIVYGGVPSGFVLKIENGPVLYHAGDTDVFSDMKLIGERYAPEIGMLPIGDHFTMGPRGAAMAAKFLALRAVLPIHFGTMPQLTGTPEELERELGGTGIEVLRIQPGETLS